MTFFRNDTGIRVIVVSVLLAGSQFCLAGGTNDALGFKADLTNSTRLVEITPKPSTFNSFTDRLIYIHDNLHPTVQSYVAKADNIGTHDEDERVETPPARFRIMPTVEFEYLEGVDVSFNPELEMEVDLPNLERRWSIIVENSSGNDLPGLNASERDDGSQIGIQNRLKDSNIRSSVGVRATWPPEFYVRAEWVPEWSLNRWVFRPKERLFYETDDGFGSLTSLVFHRWFGANDDTYFQWISSGKYTTEQEDGTEMEQSLKLGLVREALEDKWNSRKVLDTEDMARGHVLTYSLFWRLEEGEAPTDRHRFKYTYRKPLYEHWIYLETEPGVDFVGPDSIDNSKNNEDGTPSEENEWEIIPTFRIGVDMLFWGTKER